MLVRRPLAAIPCLAVLLALAGAPVPASRAGEVYVAGVIPDHRREDAPRVLAPSHPKAWYVAAVRGVEPPYPPSLFFLDSQGDWYTPFNRPGMTGRYDLRGWHRDH